MNIRNEFMKNWKVAGRKKHISEESVIVGGMQNFLYCEADFINTVTSVCLSQEKKSPKQGWNPLVANRCVF